MYPASGTSTLSAALTHPPGSANSFETQPPPTAQTVLPPGQSPRMEYLPAASLSVQMWCPDTRIAVTGTPATACPVPSAITLPSRWPERRRRTSKGAAGSGRSAPTLGSSGRKPGASTRRSWSAPSSTRTRNRPSASARVRSAMPDRPHLPARKTDASGTGRCPAAR